MFKKANDQLTYVGRTGSHATREHATGRIDMIPSSAEQPVEYFNTLHDQYKALQAQYQPLVKQAAVCREQLKRTMPHEQYRRTQASYVAACEAIARIEQQFAELRPLIRAARNDAKTEFMWQMAKTLLRPHDVEHIEAQCALFAATALEIPASLQKKSIGELEGAQHDERARAGNQKDRRRKARQLLEVAKGKGAVMYEGRCFDTEPCAVPPAEDMSDRLKQLADRFNSGRTR